MTVTTVDGLLQVSFRPAEPQIPPLDDVDRDTDRLFFVEHGRTGLDQGIARLAEVAAELQALSAEEFCDQLLDRLLPQRVDDDVALLAIRCHPQAASG